MCAKHCQRLWSFFAFLVFCVISVSSVVAQTVPVSSAGLQGIQGVVAAALAQSSQTVQSTYHGQVMFLPMQGPSKPAGLPGGNAKNAKSQARTADAPRKPSKPQPQTASKVFIPPVRQQPLQECRKTGEACRGSEDCCNKRCSGGYCLKKLRVTRINLPSNESKFSR
ncbi:MAG TPA: hypothetical protein PLL10_01970 [Elusimicrobiales bacterium]|nr:hypothetical protein [Elusimicrobiales bacterium]